MEQLELGRKKGDVLDLCYPYRHHDWENIGCLYSRICMVESSIDVLNNHKGKEVVAKVRDAQCGEEEHIHK